MSTGPEPPATSHDARDRLLRQYVSVVSQRLNRHGETALQHAYDLGRQALDHGLGVLEIALMHQEAMLTVLHEHPEDSLQVGRAATAVLLETLAPVEMARRGFEARLLEAEKLVAIGSVLSAGAHELADPLAVILDNVTLMRGAGPGAAGMEHVARVAEAGERCAGIVQDLLGLARQHPPQRQMVSLNEVVRDALPLLSYQFRVHRVEVALDLSPELPPLWADAGQLRQVIVNLSANADQALRQAPPPRRLRVATRSLPPRRVLLEVADNGPGLPAEQQRRMLERVVAGESRGQGEGLGLPLCRRIVEWHGGALRAESTPGRGATFSIELPVAPAPAALSTAPADR
jgi:signal transduction histidine kinase